MCFSARLACFCYRMVAVLFVRFQTDLLNVPNRELRGRPTADPHLPAAITSQLWPGICVQSARLQSPSGLPVSLRLRDRKCQCQWVSI